ncbi:phenylacetate--CoA ligase family protein [Streptomyces sp. NPDC059788]|uniref:phenylacetate--CoA ligase family protein n=1 Tax=Streptomyces sp. NPDC059788 TaxID=3346948 RepID=UPI0036596F5E
MSGAAPGNSAQDVALAGLLGYARHHVPYYQTVVPPGPLTAENAVSTLRRLPLLHRTDVRRERPRLWSADGDARQWRKVHTTGTTGAPLEVVVDQAAQQAELGALMRHVARCAQQSTGLSVAHLTLHLASASRSSAGPKPSGTRLVKWNLSRAWQLTDTEFRRVAQELQGTVVTVMPSVAAALCARLGPKAEVRPRLIVLSGEQFTEHLRERVKDTFGCPVTALYTLAEAGIVAYECGETRSYHLEETGVFLEVVGDDGSPLPAGESGDIAVTPLMNRAMPLLRYVIGDRGVLVDDPCGCGQSGPRLRLLGSRTQHALVRGPGNRGVRSIDLAKLCRQLDLAVCGITRDGDELVVEHRDEHPATDVQRTAIGAALRSAIGPGLTVRTVQVTGSPAAGSAAAPAPVPPAILPPQDIAAWAREELRGRPGVLAAVLTGSALDPSTLSRFSDIDMTIVIDGDPCQEQWFTLAAAMNRHIATLRVNVSQAAGLAKAPLVAGRLLAERHPVVGTLEAAGVAWPAVGDLASEGRFWAQNAENVLWTRLTSADRGRTDPVRDAWLASRFCLDALRYRLLCEGGRVTAARQVLRLAPQLGAPDERGIRHAFDVGREHRPPPVPGSPEADGFLRTALAAVRWTGGFL